MTNPIEQIANALERMSPAPLKTPDFSTADAYLWHTKPDHLEAIPNVSRVDLDLLVAGGDQALPGRGAEPPPPDRRHVPGRTSLQVRRAAAPR